MAPPSARTRRADGFAGRPNIRRVGTDLRFFGFVGRFLDINGSQTRVLPSYLSGRF